MYKLSIGRKITLSLRIYAVLGIPALALGLSQAGRCERIRSLVLMQGTPSATPYYVIKGDSPGPVVVVVGGIHGDEVAGYLAARKLVHWGVTRGTLVVLPDANTEAIRRNLRGYQGDLNRMFPGRSNGDRNSRLAFEIFRMVRSQHPQIVVTMHESRDFHADDPTRFGQTFCFDFSALVPLMQQVAGRVNSTIRPAKNRFQVFVKPYPTCLSYLTCQVLHVPATAIETCRSLPIQLRIKYQLMAAEAFFDSAGLGYTQHDVPPLSTRRSSKGGLLCAALSPAPGF